MILYIGKSKNKVDKERRLVRQREKDYHLSILQSLLVPENAKEIHTPSPDLVPERNHRLNGGGRRHSMNCTSRIGACADVHAAVDVMQCAPSSLHPDAIHPICNMRKKKMGGHVGD
jgi:hypothetical protein